MAKPRRRRQFRLYGNIPALGTVPPRIRDLALPRIVKKGAEIAKEEAPILRGESSPKSIVSRISGVVERKSPIGHIYSRAPHSHLLEFGTKEHSLRGGSGRSKKKAGHPLLIFGQPGIVRMSAIHPGSKANPFMQRTENRLPDVADVELLRAAEIAMTEAIRDGKELLDGIL